LIVVVIRNEILYGIFRKKLFEFVVELRCQGFVVGKNEGRPLYLLDDVRYGKGFSTSGNS